MNTIITNWNSSITIRVRGATQLINETIDSSQSSPAEDFWGTTLGYRLHEAGLHNVWIKRV